MRAIIKELKFGGWSIDRIGAQYVIDMLDTYQPKSILDVGSGISTAIFADWAKDNDAKVTTLEHSSYYKNQTEKLLKKHKLKGNILLSNLIKTEHGYFYSSELPIAIDFVLVDGPPSKYGRMAALYYLWPYLSKKFMVLLDDANRVGERQILQKWQQDFTISVDINHYRIAEIRPL